MSDRKRKIEKGYSFNTIEDERELADKEKAMVYYFNKLNSALSLREGIPVFLDTNVLLRGYSVSPERRALLHKFFLEKKEQIVITRQVHQEFINVKNEVIATYAQLPDTQVSDLSDALASLYLELGTAPENEETGSPDNSGSVQDELLDLLSTFEQIDNLSVPEKKFLAREFDYLSSTFDPRKIKEEIKKPNKAFPGMGDILEKPEFPYGDYFLYHEMLKYSYEQNQDVVFLTFDVAKGDWLKTNKEPYEHYIHKTFALNKKAIFIFDANKFFEDLFSTSFDSLVPVEKKLDQYIVKSRFENELTAQFSRLERSIRKLARKKDIEATNDISAKHILDEMNYDDIISNDTYYELIGIWSIRDGLIQGDVETVRRQYDPDELAEVLEVVKYNIKVMEKLFLSLRK